MSTLRGNPETGNRTLLARLTDTAVMSETTTSSDMAASEQLARRWFATVASGKFDELPALVHENVQIVSKLRAGTVVDGREAVGLFIEESICAQPLRGA